MRNSLIVALAIIILVAVGSAGIYWTWQKQKVQTQPTPSPTPSPISKFPSTLGESKANGPLPSVQPQAGADTASVNLGIEITAPYGKSQISSSVKIKGLANVPEESVIAEIKDASGKVLGTSYASACFDSHPCPFEASIVFESPTGNSGTLEVRSPESGYSDSVQVFF